MSYFETAKAIWQRAEQSEWKGELAKLPESERHAVRQCLLVMRGWGKDGLSSNEYRPPPADPPSWINVSAEFAGYVPPTKKGRK